MTLTELEKRAAERQMQIGAAIERAAGELPDGYEVQIHVERGAASVYLGLPDGGSGDIDVDADNRLVAEINAAIDTAKRAAE